MNRKRRAAIVALLGAALGGFAAGGPVATASAQCDTLATCAVEQAQGKVNEVLATVQPVVDTAMAKVEAAKVAAVDTATKGTKICVVQGRWHTIAGDGAGRADCAVYDGSNPTSTSKVQSGTIEMWNADVTSGPVPVFTGNRNFGLDVGMKLTIGGEEQFIILDAVGANVPAYTGNWSSTEGGSGMLATATLDLLPASTIDPSGGSDYFVNGVVVVTQPKAYTLLL